MVEYIFDVKIVVMFSKDIALRKSDLEAKDKRS